jgi:hypothetical protein
MFTRACCSESVECQKSSIWYKKFRLDKDCLFLGTSEVLELLKLKSLFFNLFVMYYKKLKRIEIFSHSVSSHKY